MRILYGVAVVWLVEVLTRVSAEKSTIRIKTTFPDDLFSQDAPNNGTIKGVIQPRQNNNKVRGYITRSGDIFELAGYHEMESIESRQEPDEDAGVTMCRYGSIVVYSDVDCNSFFQPGSSVINRNRISQSDLDWKVEERPLKKKKKQLNRNRRRKPSKKKLKNKKQNKNKKSNKRTNKLRRKPVKRRGTKNRKQNTFNQNRRKYPQRTKKSKYQGRGNKNDFERSGIDKFAETRSHLNPLQFVVHYN